MSRVIHVLGSGPSMNLELAKRLRNEKTITINSTVHIALEAGLDEKGILFFMDADWGLKHKDAIDKWRGSVITTARFAQQKMPFTVKLVDVVESKDFPVPPLVRKGRTTGHTAIGLAISLGANRVILHGYDMRIKSGRSHHHNDYSTVAHPAIYVEFISKFVGWDAAAHRVGVEVVNATPNSALAEFPLVVW